MKEYKILRRFDKQTSVFKEWTDENQPLLKKAFEKDLENSKISRFVKDMLEFRRVYDVLLEYTEIIKDVFTYSIAQSSFPSISWYHIPLSLYLFRIDFCNLCSEWKIPDTKTCTMQTIDRVFIATNVELIEQEDNPDRDLCRFEFYEILLRMGGAKYKDSGLVSTWDAAANMILDKNIIPNTVGKMMGG